MIALFIGILFMFKSINKKPRITMATYKEPKPCVGCPGENGSPVFLTV
jgi:hypothetical protein